MRIVLICLLSLLPLIATAETQPLTYDRVSFSEQASSDVDNDELVAIMYVEREGQRAERLADEVNRIVDRAVEHAKQVPGIKVQTQSYRTTAVYRKTEISGWRVHQSIRLESRDSQRLGDLVGELQKTLNVQSISYQLSDQQRREHERQLVQEALKRFQERAKLIAESLGKSAYRMVHININSSGGQAPMPFRSEMLRSAPASMSVASAPRIEAGTQRLTVTVNAEVELTP
jgi:predicted secreted protein